MKKALAALTLLMAMRMMTVAHVAAAGSGLPGAPPAPWLLPLLGDAVIGLTAIPVALLAWKGRGLLAWTAVVVWNALAAWDSISAFLVNHASPWNDFDLLRAFGPSMFFVSAAVNLVMLAGVAAPRLRAEFLGPAAA